MSQSWESLFLDDTDSWSTKNDSELSNSLTNALHMHSPSTGAIGSSPSPTSNRNPIRLPPFALSPSPTRKTFTTRRSMSPIAMRPSSLGPVKRKFELDDNYTTNSYSPPPFKKVFTDRYVSNTVVIVLDQKIYRFSVQTVRQYVVHHRWHVLVPIRLKVVRHRNFTHQNSVPLTVCHHRVYHHPP